MSSLIPERPLLISPSLAATIGLEEATMLGVLTDLARHRPSTVENNFSWLRLDQSAVEQHFPFWTDVDIQRIAKNLCDKGVLLLRSAPYRSSLCLDFAFNEKTNADDAISGSLAASSAIMLNELAHNQITRGANRIAPNWQPNDEVINQIQQRGISAEFALQQLPEFITFWRERDEAHHAWGAKFLKHVLREWRNHETEFGRNQGTSVMAQSWQPSEDALEVLIKHASINAQFVEDAIPEFVLYWQERGESSRTWNSKFIQHVRRQWNRYTATVENDTVPKTIPADWNPSEDVFDVLRLANIDIGFAKNRVQEFVMFWRDCNQVASSWNTKFLQHVKYHWAKSHQSLTSNATVTNKTRERSLVDDLTDRSWAF